METYTYRTEFHMCFGDCGTAGPCKQYDGKPFTVTRAITEPDDTHDEESIPMFEIQCEGITIEAWPEEVLAQ